MSETIVNRISSSIGDNYSKKDLKLISTFDVFTNFNPSKDVVEFSIYNEQGLLEYIDYNFEGYSVTLSSTTDKNVFSTVGFNPEGDLLGEGYDQGIYTTNYNLLKTHLSSSQESPFYIQEISSDRTELRIVTNDLPNSELDILVNSFKEALDSQSYFEDFYINFGNNNLYLANNILLDTTNETRYSVLVKLYEPLETQFEIKDTLWIVTQTTDEVSYNIVFPNKIIAPPSPKLLRGPNLNISQKDTINNSTTYQNLSELTSTTLTSSLNELQQILSEKGITINVDYSEFYNFVNFSSAEQRVRNFYYKINQIQGFDNEISDLGSLSSTSVSSSIAVLENRKKEIIKNFDEYEKYQYYSSGSSNIYPKTNDEVPYILAETGSADALIWLNNQTTTGSEYDLENRDRLVNSLPEYTKEDTRNTPFLLFMDMVGQHFDNIWVYTENLSDRFNADNRLTYGISKDLVADAIKSMGVNLYQNNFTSNNLYSSFIGLNPEGGTLFPTGSEVIETEVTASNKPTIIDDVNKEFYKRIFHNLPFLLKKKGSVEGLRALINTFGIPDTVLRISEFGGKDKVSINDWDYFQNTFNYAWDVSGSLDAVNNGNGGEFPFLLNNAWNSADNKPESVAFRFKLNTNEGLPSEATYTALADFNTGGTNGVLALEYTGSGFSSASYSGSIPSSSNEYATLVYYNGSTKVTSVDAPFYNNDWWTVYINKNSTTYTLRVGNNIYKGPDGYNINFYSSSQDTNAGGAWAATLDLEIPGADVIIGSNNYGGFTGSVQEIRYYNCALDENTFYDLVMNSDSIEGSTFTSSADNLCFRARLKNPLGGLNAVSVHPKVTGSFITNSFPSDSNYKIWNYRENNFSPHSRFLYQDQPAVGIKNRVSEKIRNQEISIPLGNTLSSLTTIQQDYLTPKSGSYTKDINLLEVAFSPQSEINDDINASLGYFNIGEYIGDPRYMAESVNSYPALDKIRDTYFEKYYKNYNWTDYIRLIKFFDNSLFKMVKDFTPAKSNLAAGVVIKQHLLERNKQRPALVTSSLHDYTASITSGFSEGGTGGVFDSINGLGTNPYWQASGSKNYLSPQLTQSWEYFVPTPLGSLVVTQSSQDEFYNGELSGSYIQVSQTNITPNDIQNGTNFDPFNGFSVIRVKSTRHQTNNSTSNIIYAGLEDFTDMVDQVSNAPIIGAIIDPISGFVNTFYVNAVNLFNYEGISDTTSITSYLDKINSNDFLQVQIATRLIYPNQGAGVREYLGIPQPFKVISSTPQASPGGNTYYKIQVETITNDPVFNEILFNPQGGDNSILNASSDSYYQFRIFHNGGKIGGTNPILNVIENNVIENRKSTIYSKLDYNTGTLVPTNLQTVLNSSIESKVSTPDSNYSSKSWKRSRYEGTKQSSLGFNITIAK